MGGTEKSQQTFSAFNADLLGGNGCNGDFEIALNGKVELVSAFVDQCLANSDTIEQTMGVKWPAKWMLGAQ